MEADPHTFRCHRGRLEKFLQEEQEIRWGKTLEGIEATNQKIILHLNDNETLETEVLIGTDGVHSQVRESLASNIKLKVLPFIAYRGTRRMKIADYEDVVAPTMQGMAIIQSRYLDILLEISINHISANYADLSYTYSRPVHQDDQLHKPDRSNSESTNVPEAFYLELDQLGGLRGAFKAIFNSSEVRRDRVLHWVMRTTLGTPEQVKSLADRGAMLIGDAVHAMPILGGEGANTAMKDGVDLADYIARNGTNSLHGFSKEKFQAWKDGVEASEHRISEMHNPAKAYL